MDVEVGTDSHDREKVQCLATDRGSQALYFLKGCYITNFM